ncbi:MAG: autotransporter domain-containing protein [Alphaproteobacteria bacterium]|nr:autotransporter domain-containing protein [Alphaproteobacteria bacterium]
MLKASHHDRACRLRADPDRPVTSIATGLTALIVATAAIAPSQTVAQTWNGTGSDYGTAGNWTPNNVPDATGENAVLDDTGATEPIVDLGAGTFSPDSVTINGATSYTIQNGTLDLANGLTNNSSADQTISAIISGAGGLSQDGDGTLTLLGTNTYTGTTTVSAGTVAVTGAGTLASTAVTVTGGTLQTDGGALSATANVTVNDGTFAIEGDETINLLTNNADAITTVAAGTTLSADVIGNNFGATFTVSGTLDATTRVENAFGSVIDFRGDGTLGASTLLNDNGIVEFFDSSSAGTGVINNGGFTQFFDDSTADNATITSNAGFIQFFNNSTAGSATITVNVGFAQFSDNSTAGTSTITVDGGRVQFRDNSTAGSATITNNNLVQFVDDGTAGSGTITNNSITQFHDNSTAGTATITNTAGSTTTFIDNSTAGDARLINLAGGTIDFSGTTGPLDDNRISAGSIAGGGAYVLGANALTVGGNNDTTEVSGEISGAGGSLVKQGTGTLTLSGVNTHTGGTTISGGTLTVSSGGSLVSDTTVNAGSTFNIDNGAMVAGINNAGTTNASGVINGSVANAGIFGPGGRGAIGTVSVNGDFVQTASGSLAVDVDGTGGTSDLISVAGTADLAGTVDVILTGADPVGPLTILSAQGGVTDSGLMLGGVPVFANPLTNIALVFPNTNDVALSFTLDAIAGTFNPNQTAILNTINTINTTDVGDTGPMISALFALGSIEETASALDQLSPEIALNTETATQLSAANFADSLLSCPVTGGAHAAIREGDCLWVRPHGRFLDADGTANRIGFEETAGGISIGGQYEAWTNWHAGLALGYEHGDLDTNSGAGATSDRFHAGGTLKYQHGAMVIAGAIYGGVDTYDTTRTIGFGGFSAVNTADYNIAHVGAKLRAAYLMEHGGFYAKPLVDVNFTHLDRDGFTEDGNPAATLTVHGGSDTYFSVSPAIEVGSDHAMAEGWRLHTHLKAGVTVYSQDQNTLTARFAGAPAAAPSFQITSELDDVFADFEAGALLQGEKAAIELGYQGRISSDASQHGGFIKGSLKF